MKMMHRFLVIMGKVMTFGRLEGPPLPAVYVKIISNLSLIITTTFDLSLFSSVPTGSLAECKKEENHSPCDHTYKYRSETSC